MKRSTKRMKRSTKYKEINVSLKKKSIKKQFKNISKDCAVTNKLTGRNNLKRAQCQLRCSTQITYILSKKHLEKAE